ncbi:SCO family protein [Spongiimicrobium sp. 3-5]|uniref:SCO family protein n=1 Tax=Spongiimicrobium sp. 3-5 TaxID=3332596 RepID=UPI00397EFF72
MGLLKKMPVPLELILFLSLIAAVILHKVITAKDELPIYNPSDLNPQLVDRSKQGESTGHTVADFQLVNQNGKVITQADYSGKIYVADFFFTRCPTICPIMTSNMAKLQEQFKGNDMIRLLSLSVTPEMDSVAVLRNYADRHGALDGIWNITTGDKKHIYDLARKSYFAVVDEGDGGLQDFIHTPNFVLVDKEKRIRGIYDGTKEEEIKRLIVDIKRLLN